MFNRSVESYLRTNKNGKQITFFDRGIPDALCYSTLIHSAITKVMQLCAENYRYNNRVFVLPPWFEIYQTDNERKQNWEEAVLTCAAIKDTYLQCNYQIIEVPKLPVESRVEFVINTING